MRLPLLTMLMGIGGLYLIHRCLSMKHLPQAPSRLGGCLSGHQVKISETSCQLVPVRYHIHVIDIFAKETHHTRNVYQCPPRDTLDSSMQGGNFRFGSGLKRNLCNTHKSYTVPLRFDKVRALETVFTEHDAIKCEVGVSRQLVEKGGARNREDEEFGTAGGYCLDDDDARSIRTIVPHELEHVEEEDEDQIAKQEEPQDEDEEEERRTRRVEHGRPRTPEPMSLGMTHDEEDIARSSRSSTIRHRRTVPTTHIIINPAGISHRTLFVITQLSTPSHKAPYPFSNPSFLSRIARSTIPSASPTRTPAPRLTHYPNAQMTGKNPSRANGLPL